jgi:outer membrane protein assembly factor BamB
MRHRSYHRYDDARRRGAKFARTELAQAVAVFLPIIAAISAHAENWDRFRGPNGAGQSQSSTIPSQWKADNFLWKAPLPGIGHSSPIIWDLRVFVTSADAETGQLIVSAFEVYSGQSLWERRFPGTAYSKHAFNSYASPTPAADAERIYLVHREGTKLRMVALTHDGEPAWEADVGVCEEKHGFGSSPVVVDDLVCVQNDNDRFGEIVALDRASGASRWRVARPPGETSFCTPLVVEPGAGPNQLVVASNGGGVAAIDIERGEVAWRAAENDLPQRVVGSPIVAAGLVIVTCGAGGNGLQMLALSPPRGNEPAREVYRLRQGVPQVPTAVAAGELLFLWHDGGTVMCVDAATGKQHWRKRVTGKCHGSPIHVDGRLFGVSIDGEVVVIEAKPEFKLLARNSLGEPSRATPAAAHDRLYIRTESSLLCIGEE